MSTDNWLSFVWFDPDQLRQFVWEAPFYFYFLFVIPLLFLLRWLLGIRLKQKLPIALSREKLRSSPLSLLRFVPDLLMAMVLSLIIISLARPQITNEMVEQWTEGIDIILAIDISESMQGQDFQPNRLEAAKAVARDFISGRFQDRIGLVIFSGEAYSLSPLTTDYILLKNLIDEIDFGKIQKGGTAIGSALAVATNRMRESTANTKVIILLSDGDNTAGNIDPVMAAQLAHAFEITIYTIVVGKEGRVPYGQNMFGQTVYMDNTVDETNLREIARIAEGRFYRATDNQALENIFDLIDEYEKAEIKETRYRDTIDYYVVYLQWAVLLFLIWILLKSTFMGNVLRD